MAQSNRNHPTSKPRHRNGPIGTSDAHTKPRNPAATNGGSEKAPRRGGIEEKTRFERRSSLSLAAPHPHLPPDRSPSALSPLRLSHHRASYREGACEHTKNTAAGKGRARENERATTLRPCGAKKLPSLKTTERRAPAHSAPRCSWTRASTTVDRQECACALDITTTRVRSLIHL